MITVNVKTPKEKKSVQVEENATIKEVSTLYALSRVYLGLDISIKVHDNGNINALTLL